MGSRTVRIPRRRTGGHSVAVVPCGVDRGCFRWTILSDDGRCAERSAYAYATVAGARAVGEIRLREQRLGH
jgi:hypothetical protein